MKNTKVLNYRELDAYLSEKANQPRVLVLLKAKKGSGISTLLSTAKMAYGISYIDDEVGTADKILSDKIMEVKRDSRLLVIVTNDPVVMDKIYRDAERNNVAVDTVTYLPVVEDMVPFFKVTALGMYNNVISAQRIASYIATEIVSLAHKHSKELNLPDLVNSYLNLNKSNFKKINSALTVAISSNGIVKDDCCKKFLDVAVRVYNDIDLNKIPVITKDDTKEEQSRKMEEKAKMISDLLQKELLKVDKKLYNKSVEEEQEEQEDEIIHKHKKEEVNDFSISL